MTLASGVRILAISLLFSAAAVGPASAQEQAAEGTARDARDRWKVGLDFALTSASGNENITVLTSGLKVAHLFTEAYELELATSVRYGRSEGEEVARNLRGRLGFDFQPETDFSPFVFVSAERDPFRRLDVRAHGGAGARYRLWRAAEGQEVSLSMATLYSYEDRRLDAGSVGVAPIAREARLSWRFRAIKRLARGVTLESTTFYQPVWDSYGDYLVQSESAARMLVTDWVALTFGYSFERDSSPLPDVRPDDHVVRGGVTLNW